jgi:hypothetical protein
VNVLAAADCGVADVIGAATIVFSSDALDSVTARARKLESRAAAGSESEDVAA